MTPDTQDTLVRAQQGDRDAFARLIDDHYEMIFRFAFKYCGNRPDAEDIAQQTCIKLARAIGQFRFESAFSTWLYQVVINVSRDFYKSRKQTVEHHGDESAVDSDAEHVVMLNQVLALVARMGAEFRDTLVLVLGEGLSHARAAEILSVKESTVSWRIHEIRRRLNAELSPEDNTGEGDR